MLCSKAVSTIILNIRVRPSSMHQALRSSHTRNTMHGTEICTQVTRLVRLWTMCGGGQAVQHCQWLLSLRYNKSWLYKTKQAAGCTALGLSPSYIVFGLLQILASTKDEEVLIVERRDDEE